MRAPVSVVIPALDDRALLERALAGLASALDGPDGRDEIVVVDDTGRDVLAAWARGKFPRAKVIARAANGGFARALTDGIAAARHALVFCMNSDLAVRGGFLEPLVDALEDPQVFAAVPRVLLGGDPVRVESLVRIEVEAGPDGGIVRLAQPALEDPPRLAPLRDLPVPFAVGGACLLRKTDFAALGGFDADFEPFYLEDVDLCWRAWRAGRRVVLCSGSEVAHQGRGTIGKVAPAPLVRAAIEKNLLLFQWKHLDEPAAIAAHLAALERAALSAWVEEDRERLIWLALALEQFESGARPQAPARRTFAEIVRESDPFSGQRA